MIRVLHIVGQMNMGGQETFIMNLYRKIDKEKVQFDFVVSSKDKGYYDDEIEENGGKIYRITSMSENILKHCNELMKILKKGNYKIIHRHTASSIILFELLVAKICNIPNIIVHSHNTNTSKKFIHKIFRPFMNKLCNYKFACSEDAGKWLFGKKEKFEVINNGIDVKKYEYNEKIRCKKRKELKVMNKFVIGNVARFNKQKNHEFILNVFEEILKIKPDSVLLLVGDGEEKLKIQEKCKLKKIEDKVIFLGVRKDVNEIMQAFDVFLFPSLYEGLPLTLIEAQASGIKIYASSTITPKVNITNNINFISLSDNAAMWAKKIVENDNIRNLDIESLYNLYDSTKIAQKIQQKYLDMNEEKKII